MKEIEDLLNLLKSKKKRSDARKNLDAVYRTCLHLKELGEADFQVTKVYSAGKLFGVPKVQSLRNDKDYLALICAFRDSSQLTKSGKSKKHDSWIDEIDNPRHKILTMELAEEAKRLRAQVKEMKPIDNTITVYDFGRNDLALNHVEIRAIAHLQSAEFLEAERFTIGPRGEILKENGDQLLPVGTIHAVKKILKSFSH